jgi:hypothetical protein
MRSRYSFEQKDNYLRLLISGEYDFKDFSSYLEIVSTECERRKIYLVLLDLLNVEMSVPLMERITLGEETARKFKKRIKMAIIGDENYINRVYEIVVLKLGGNVFVSGDESKAIHWLLDENP